MFVVAVPDCVGIRRWGEASGLAACCLLCLWTNPGIRVESFPRWGSTRVTVLDL